MKVIVEGLWAIGKTSLCTMLQDMHGFTFINEPDHREQILKIDDLDNWYYQEHLKSLKLAISLDTPVVWERCFVSTLAYERAIDPNRSIINRISDEEVLCKKVDKLIFMEVDIENYLEYLDSKRIPALQAIKKHDLRNFLENYQSNLLDLCEKCFVDSQICRNNIILDSDSNYYSNLKNIIELCINRTD
jgi:deoxyadenosine/deoxycytidine kinase